MKSIIASILAVFLAFASQAFAFAPVTPSSTRIIIATPTRSTPTSLSVFGKKKTEAQKAQEAEEAAKYWQGEWVCKDCGYIYNRAECAGMYFEEQG